MISPVAPVMVESLETLNPSIDPDPIIPEPIIPGAKVGRSVFALVDQGLVSCGNFFTSVLLARSLAWRSMGGTHFCWMRCCFSTACNQRF